MHVPLGVGHHYSLVARRQGMEWDPAKLDEVFRVAWTSMPAPDPVRSHRTDDDRGWWRALVGQVLTAMAPHDKFDREEYFATLYQHFAEPGVWELYPEVTEVLGQLRGEFRLGILSNFDGRVRTLLRQFEMLELFDTFIISSEVGADKPEPFIFEEALRKAGLPADEAVHVGDDPVQDWEGAEAVRIRCFHLERPVNSLLDLPAFLAASPV